MANTVLDNPQKKSVRDLSLDGRGAGALKAFPLPTVHFTGRKDILRKMTDYFNTDVGQRHVFLLHGLGGVGKSQIAFKFIEESATPEPRFSDVYFVDSTSQQTIENDLVALALAKNFGKTVHDSLLWLSHQRSEGLIVFNNADDVHLNLVQYFPAGSHGNILITSRNPNLGQLAQVKHKVDRMELQEATELLLSAAQCDITEPETSKIAEQLVKKLHCHPLAVVQAGGYISSSGALQKYLDLYESTANRIQLLNQRPPESDYEWSVYTTWQHSFENVSAQAALLLQLCSFLHHDSITEEIFRRAASYKLIAGGPTEADLREPLDFLAQFLDTGGSKWDSLKFIVLIDELACCSLIDFEPQEDITFSVHPLVHEWCRTTVKSDAPTEVCMHKLMGMSISSDNDFRFQHQIFPHLDSLLFKTTKHPNRQPNILDSSFAVECLGIYYSGGKWDAGVELGNHMLQTAPLQQSELETLRIQGMLAMLYGRKGDLHRARVLEEMVLTRRTELLGEDHRDTLSAMGNLAGICSDSGQFNKAEGLRMIVLDKYREILGEDHPDTLKAMANLAVTYLDVGQLNQAKELQQTVLTKHRELLGEDHPDTLTTMANLMVTYLQLGQFNQAEKLGTAILTKRRAILGEDHPDTLKAMDNLTVTYSRLGRFNQAEELGTTVLSKHRAILGEDHPDTLKVMANLAVTYLQLGQFSQAEELEKIILAKRRAILGEDHPDTLKAMVNLAATYSNLGQLDQAKQTVLGKYREVLGDDHPDTLQATANLAVMYSRLGQFNQAEELQKTVSATRQQVQGNNPPLG
ncbi:P-loop containing nucleoside triphosphate hydrolase protein [Mycena latifolia]|nr:P-loop containing nucleoside triphosphate hydrolase protein [Mycena latifolia]